MVHLHLRRRAQIAPPIAPDEHLDDDLLSAFTEGRLNENESAPVLKHLVACPFPFADAKAATLEDASF